MTSKHLIRIDLIWYNLFFTDANSAIFQVFKSGFTFARETPYRVGTHCMRPVTGVCVFQTFIDIWNFESGFLWFFKCYSFVYVFLPWSNLIEKSQHKLENSNESSLLWITYYLYNFFRLLWTQIYSSICNFRSC